MRVSHPNSHLKMKEKENTHLLIISALTSTSSPLSAPLLMSAFCWLKYVTNSGP